MKYVFATVFSFFLLAQSAFARPIDESAVLKTGDILPTLTLLDQHGSPHQLGSGVRRIVISFSMELSKEINAWLVENPDFLREEHIQYVSDITPMPAIISRAFAKPKMRTYPFTILLVDDADFAKVFPQEEGRLTVLEIGEASVVTRIHFAERLERTPKRSAEESIRYLNFNQQLEELKKGAPAKIK